MTRMTHVTSVTRVTHLTRVTCATSTADACSIAPSAGDCGGSETKWYFDYRDSTCRPFEYTGCGGNANRWVPCQRLAAAATPTGGSPVSDAK